MNNDNVQLDLNLALVNKLLIQGSKVLIMGLAYKENVPDTRESPAVGIVEGEAEGRGFLHRGCKICEAASPKILSLN